MKFSPQMLLIRKAFLAIHATECIGPEYLYLRIKRSHNRNISQVASSSSPKSHIEDNLYKWMKNKQKGSTKYAGNKPSTRSRLPSKGILRPVAISEKIHALCDAGRLQDAVDLVKLSPIYSQNIVVWNTILSKVLDAQKFKLAYQLFIDMKRRGHKPSNSTFITLFSKYSRIEDWQKYPVQLDNCHSLYSQYLKNVERLKSISSENKDITVGPVVLYMKILSKAGLYQKMFDVFNELDDEGRLAPDEKVFSMLLHALAHRTVLEKEDGLTVAAQNASDGKLLWRQMEKAAEKTGFPIDEKIIGPGIRLFANGRPADHVFAFDIVRKYLGLVPRDEGPFTPQSIISPIIVQSLFELCNKAKKYSLCTYHGHELLKGGFDVDRRNIEAVLFAHFALTTSGVAAESGKALDALKQMLKRGSPELLPQINTYSIMLKICSREKDWTSAMKAVELMTGYESSEFLPVSKPNGKVEAQVQNIDLINKRKHFLSLNAEIMLHLVRIASSQQNVSIMHQCLQMIQFFGGGSVLERSIHDNTEYYTSDLASELLRLLSKVCSVTKQRIEETNWQVLKKACEAYGDRLYKRDSGPILKSKSDKEYGSTMMPEAIDFRGFT